ncbi:MAG: PepSY domain-containing protein [Bacteroidota bacterium]
MATKKPNTRILRLARKIRRSLGKTLFAAFLLIGITGLLLGWKKHSGGVILPKSYQGVSTDLKTWLPIDSLHTNAVRIFRDSISTTLSTAVDRIDVRPDKGMVKFVFVDEYWGIQLDGTTGELLHIERRRSDFIENIHDGSILDYLLGTGDGQFKLSYTTIMGGSLILFSVTGFWLYYGPKRIMRRKRVTATRGK